MHERGELSLEILCFLTIVFAMLMIRVSMFMTGIRPLSKVVMALYVECIIAIA